MSTTASDPMPRYWGWYRGLVEDTADPKDRGRIKVKIPEILADVVSGWAMPNLPYSGKEMGWFAIPEKGTGVWVTFEAGDVSRPIWAGCWWGDKQVPEKAKPVQKVMKTQSGHTVIFDDEKKTILVRDAHKQEILLDDKGIHVKDVNKQTIDVDDKGIAVVDKHKQKIITASKGIEISKSGVKINLEAAKITVTTGSQKIEMGPAAIKIETGAHKIEMGPAATKITAGSQSIEMGPVSTKINGGALEVM